MNTAPTRSSDRDESDGGVHDDAVVGHDDYSLARVPQSARYSWWTMATQRFGMLSSLAQFFLGAFLGFGMGFWQAMLAVLLGSVLLEIVTIFVGIAGQREGLSTSLLARWSGFGSIGAGILGLVLSISLIGWFGVQTEVFGTSLSMIPVLSVIPVWVLSLLGGLLVTLIVVYGIRWMNWVAFIAVPAFLALVTYNFVQAISNHDLGELMGDKFPGQELSLAAGTTIVAGGFIAGAIFTPDLSRFNRTPMDVVKQTVVGVTLGEFYVGALGVLLAHTVKEVAADTAPALVNLLAGNVGWLALIIVCLSVVKVNDWNLYPSSLGTTNALNALFGLKVNRVYVALVIGLLGSFVAAAGVTQHFQGFLGFLGTFFPGIAAVMIADYFVVKSFRSWLDSSRANGGRLPATAPLVVPAGLVAWIVGFVVALLMGQNPQFLAPINVPAIVALVVSFLTYTALGALGLAVGVGESKTPAAVADEQEPVESGARVLGGDLGELGVRVTLWMTGALGVFGMVPAVLYSFVDHTQGKDRGQHWKAFGVGLGAHIVLVCVCCLMAMAMAATIGV